MKISRIKVRNLLTKYRGRVFRLAKLAQKLAEGQKFKCPGSRTRAAFYGSQMGNPVVTCDACGHYLTPTKSPRGLVPVHGLRRGEVVA